MSTATLQYGTVLYEMPHGTTPVRLTLVGAEDEDVLARHGVAQLRRLRIVRLSNEAHAQCEPLSYDDMSALLLTSLATLKRDVRIIEQAGLHVPLRGRRRHQGACEG